MSTSQLQSGYAPAGGGGAGLTGFTSAAYDTSPHLSVNTSAIIATGATANVDAVLQPKGQGAIAAQVADGTATGGNKRGTGAVDFQVARTANTQIAAGAFAVLVGGNQNTVTGSYNAMLGGQVNSISTGMFNVVGGGSANSLTGASDYSFLGAGQSNSISNQFAFIGAGSSNSASGSRSVIGGGMSNTATGSSATVSGGSQNGSRNFVATVGGGSSNNVWAQAGTIPGGDANYVGPDVYGSTVVGTNGRTDLRNAFIHGGGALGQQGDCQFERFIYGRRTTDAVQTEIANSNATADDTNTYRITSTGLAYFKLDLIARQEGTPGHIAVWQISGVLRNEGGTHFFVGTPTVTSIATLGNGSTWSVAVAVATTRLRILATGQAATNIKWAGSLETIRVLT